MKRPRPSLPRPESPVRRLMTPGPRPSIGGVTPGVKPPSRYGSPTPNRFAQSVRGTSGDPRKGVPRLERKPSVGPRSASALGQSMEFPEHDMTPMATGRPKTNGSVGSVSSFNSKFRPASRTGNNDDHQEAERLRHQLEERDRQLREQAATLADMESSLTELQTLMENPDALRPRRNSLDDKDSTQLRAILREKNEKIAMLTAEFDAHRADFRSTIDTLEMASTETERVYEKRIEELMQEIRDHESRTDDVDSGSLAALTPSSLASIPDASESYGLNTVLSDPPDGKRMAPTTPGRTPRAASALVGGDDFVVGDLVDVPGNMYGTVRFIGPVQGKKGTFAGVELHSDFAPRGKNSGDVD
ncbi:hypothetical protein BN1723_016858, partial [Verticillium longisporum]